MSLSKQSRISLNIFVASDSSNQPPQEDKMDPDVRMDLEFILEKNLDEIITKYASYVDCLRIIVREKGILPEDLCSYLLSLSASSKSSKGQKLSLLSDKKSELEKKTTITDIFNFLTTECAFFLNYDIFQKIITKYKITEDREELKYCDHLKAFIEKHKISEFVKINPLLKHTSGSEKLILKCDIESTCNLAKVDELKKLVAKVLDLNPSTLQIFDIEDGCVVVTFLIPASVVDSVFTPKAVFTSQQEDELRTASVLWLECNGYRFEFGKAKVHTEHQENPGNNTLIAHSPVE